VKDYTKAPECNPILMEKITHSVKESDWRAAHGVLFLLLMAICSLIPSLSRWPWIWVAPFSVYFIVVGCVPPLRRSLNWLQGGKVSPTSIAATIGLMVVTVLVLTYFQSTMKPDVRGFGTFLPFKAIGGASILGVALFSIVNATLEESVFRGVLFDALQSRSGGWVSLAATTLLFGVGHLNGYPPGPVGVCLATLFGLAMGGLRIWTGGIALPIVAHIAADATIYTIIAS